LTAREYGKLRYIINNNIEIDEITIQKLEKLNIDSCGIVNGDGTSCVVGVEAKRLAEEAAAKKKADEAAVKKAEETAIMYIHAGSYTAPTEETRRKMQEAKHQGVEASQLAEQFIAFGPPHQFFIRALNLAYDTTEIARVVGNIENLYQTTSIRNNPEAGWRAEDFEADWWMRYVRTLVGDAKTIAGVKSIQLAEAFMENGVRDYTKYLSAYSAEIVLD
jgi:hypothetical protein